MKIMRLVPLFILPSIMVSALFGCAHGMSQTDEADVAHQAAPMTYTNQRVDDVMVKSIAASVLQRMPLISDMKTLVYANSVGQYIAQELIPSLKCRASRVAATDIRIAVVKSVTPSSFSLPGGMIFVTTSLIQKMTTEDELAGVLANEIVTSVCEKGFPANLAAQASTGWSDFVLTLPTKALDRQDLAFADRYALVTLYRRGYDIAPYVNFVAKNELSGRHTSGADRAAALKKNIAATPTITPTSSARIARFQAAKAKSL